MGGLISSQPRQLSLTEQVVIAYLLTLFVTGVFAFVGFAYPTSRLLPNAYYKIKNPRALNRTFKILGVKYFQALLLLTFWGTKKNRIKYFNGTKAGLNNFIYQTKQSEFGHFAAFIIITALSLILLVYGYSLLVLFITIINIIGNLYPIILQRSHRIRIEKITSSASGLV
jgi:hypothetical protein